MAFHFAISIALHWKIYKYRWKRFFWEPEPPQTLAMMRILTSGAIFVHFIFQFPRNYVPLASLPHEARQPLPLIGWLIDILPISPTIFIVALILGIVFSFLAAIGLWTRPALIALIPLTFYLFRVPQFFGKLSHFQFFVWAPMILAFTPCAEVWSVDALINRIKGIRLNLKPSFEYALGIRWFTLTLVGIYFFSGVHKLYDIGLFWAMSDNPVNLLRTEWLEQFQNVPIVRVDRFPLLCNVAALGVIVFELAYPLMILSPRTRKFLALEVLAFHNLNGYFLKIDFNYLKATHLMFFDIQGFANRMKLIRRWQAWLLLIAGLVGLGWLAGVSFLILPAIVGAVINLSWHTIGLRKRVRFILALRMRFFSSKANSAKNSSEYQRRPHTWQRWSLITGIVLISLNWTFSALGINSWPFSAYPSYTFVRSATVQYGWFVPETATGKVLDLDTEAKAIGFRKENIMPMTERIVDAWKYSPSDLPKKIEACWQRWRTEVPMLQIATSAKVVIREYPLDPDAYGRLVSETHLGEMQLINGEWRSLSDSLIPTLQVPK
jgi:predicted membrane protein